MTFKRLFSILILGMASCALHAQEGYFNSTVGKTLEWVIHDGSGSLFGYCSEKLVSLKGDRDNAKVSYSYMFYDQGRKSVVGDKPFGFSVTLEKGVTRAYVNNVSKAILSGDYMLAGDISSIPDNIAVGDKLKDTEIKIKILTVFTATNRYTNRRVTARERIEVPAGTFDCFLVEDDEFFTGSGPFHTQTWVSRGVGIVKQIIYKKDGTINQVFELTDT